MKIALVVPRDPPGKHNFHQLPIGMLYAADRLRRQGADVAFCDLRVDDRGGDVAVYAEIAARDLAVVVSADYDLAQCYPSLLPAKQCIEAIRAAGSAKIACAGSHATADSARTRQFTGADTVVAGEFEFAIPELVASLSGGKGCPARWPREGTRLASDEELMNLGSPAYDLARMNCYFSEGFVDNQLDRVNSGLILANRGCPFGCSFCYLFFGRPLRRRPVEATLAELTVMHDQHGYRHFFFLDYTFTIDTHWVTALCDGINARGLKISWVCQTRVDCLDEQTLLRMQQAGCRGVWLGVESPELEQRRYLDKGRIGFKAIQEGLALIRRCGLNVLAFVMVGLPNETEASLAGLNAWLDQSQVYYSLSIFQRRLGSPLTKGGLVEMEKEGWAYLDRESDFLGESSLRRADLNWFFDFHTNSPRRMANIMRSKVAG